MSEQHFDRIGATPTTGLNPWKSIWLHPKLTVRHLLDTNPTHGVLLLAAGGGISNALDGTSRTLEEGAISTLLLLPIIIVGGVIFGIVGIYLSSWLMSWSGSWIGGRANSQQIRTALAWGNVPILWNLLVWVVLLASLGGELFTKEMPSVDANPALLIVYLSGLFISFVLAIWSLVILIAGLAEAQGFTTLRAIGNILLSGLVVMAIGLGIAIVTGIIVVIFLAATGGFAS